MDGQVCSVACIIAGRGRKRHERATRWVACWCVLTLYRDRARRRRETHTCLVPWVAPAQNIEIELHMEGGAGGGPTGGRWCTSIRDRVRLRWRPWRDGAALGNSLQCLRSTLLRLRFCTLPFQPATRVLQPRQMHLALEVRLRCELVAEQAKEVTGLLFAPEFGTSPRVRG